METNNPIYYCIKKNARGRYHFKSLQESAFSAFSSLYPNSFKFTSFPLFSCFLLFSSVFFSFILFPSPLNVFRCKPSLKASSSSSATHQSFTIYTAQILPCANLSTNCNAVNKTQNPTNTFASQACRNDGILIGKYASIS